MKYRFIGLKESPKILHTVYHLINYDLVFYLMRSVEQKQNKVSRSIWQDSLEFVIRHICPEDFLECSNKFVWKRDYDFNLC